MGAAASRPGPPESSAEEAAAKTAVCQAAGVGVGVPSGGAAGEMADIRAFVGLALPAVLQERIWASALRLAPALPEVKWIRKRENLHVTLRFLGSVALERVNALGRELAPALASVSPFAGVSAGFGAFPEPRNALVIWARVTDEARVNAEAARPAQPSPPHDRAGDRAGMDDGGRFGELARLVDEAATRVALAPREEPTRPFRPHITVGRCKRPVDARRVLESAAGETFGAFPVTAVDLYQSLLAREGSTYVLRGRIGLAGPGAAL